MGVLEQETWILQHSWQLLALLLIQSLDLQCCIHLNQDAAGMSPSGALLVRGSVMPEDGGISPLLLLQEVAPTAQEQSSALSDTYLLLFSVITCQQGDDCLDFLAVLLLSPTQQKPE